MLLVAFICCFALAGIFAFSQTVYAAEHTHKWAVPWTTNGTHHWHECTAEGCTVTEDSGKGGYGMHVYDNMTDTQCNVCKANRTAPIVGLIHENGTTTELTTDATDAGGKWSWVASTKTLTLNGWTGKGIEASTNFNLHLVGNNTINMPNNVSVDVFGINGGFDAKTTITADDGGTLTINAQNVTNNDSEKHYYGVAYVIITSGTLNVNMTAASGLRGQIYASRDMIECGGTAVVNVNLNTSAVTGSKFYSPGVGIVNPVQFKGGSPTVNVTIKAGAKERNDVGFQGYFAEETAAKITVRTSGGTSPFAVSRMSTIKLAEGGFIDFEGGYFALGMASNYEISPNSQTTDPANNEYTVKQVAPWYYLCDKDGNQLTKGRFEYVAVKEPFEVTGGEMEGEMHVFTLPDLRIGDTQFNNWMGWFGLYSTLKGYELGKVKFEVIEGTLPAGIILKEDTTDPSYTSIRGIPTEETPAGYVIVKATETVGEGRSVTFKVKWNEIKPAHTHSWASAWTISGTHHWHECTAEGCNITANNEKDGYGEHGYGDWKHNDTSHWKECTVCGLKQSTTAHIYDNDADATCNTCGYTRTIGHTHSWSTDWTHDENQHWHVCLDSECSEKNDVATHVYNQQVTTDEYKNTDATHSAKATYFYSCVCGKKGTETFEYGDVIAHNHSTEWSKDESGHYHECDCGDKKDVAEHVYADDQDTTCDVCGYERTVTPVDPVNPVDPVEPTEKQGLSGGAIAAIAVGGVAIAGIGGFSIFWFVVKKKSFAELIAVIKAVFKK